MGFSEYNTPDAIQLHLWQGYGKVAGSQGQLTGVYRPTSAIDPFTNQITALPIVFTNNYGFIKPDKFGSSVLYAIFDGTNIQEGDYLVTPPLSQSDLSDPLNKWTQNLGIIRDVFYVSSMDMNVPILIVECQRTVSISRVTSPNETIGVQSYAGSTQALETILMSNWRASILQGTKGESNKADLPGDVRMPWWIIIMPSFLESSQNNVGFQGDSGDYFQSDSGDNLQGDNDVANSQNNAGFQGDSGDYFQSDSGDNFQGDNDVADNDVANLQPIILDTGDIIRCDLGRKYVVSSAEITDMGWRITATYERA